MERWKNLAGSLHSSRVTGRAVWSETSKIKITGNEKIAFVRNTYIKSRPKWSPWTVYTFHPIHVISKMWFFLYLSCLSVCLSVCHRHYIRSTLERLRKFIFYEEFTSYMITLWSKFKIDTLKLKFKTTGIKNVKNRSWCMRIFVAQLSIYVKPKPKRFPEYSPGPCTLLLYIIITR